MSTEEEKLSAGKELKPMQRRFCAQYIVDYNGTKAAERAGYKKESAAAQASRLLRNDKVAAYVRELEEQYLIENSFLSKNRLTREVWETYLKSISAVPVMQWDYKEHKMAPVEGEYTFDGKTATKCLEILTKHLGAGSETVNLGNAKDENGNAEAFEVNINVLGGEGI